MRPQLIVGLVEVSFDGRLLNGAVHSLDLPVGPWMFRFGQPMIDVMARACEFEGMRAERLLRGDHLFDLSRRPSIASRIGEVQAVVGQDCVDSVRNSFDERIEEICGDARRGPLVQFDECELRRPVDRHEQIEPAFGGANLGDVDMEIADRIGFELAFGGDLVADLGQL